MESYRVIIDASGTSSGPGRTPTAEAFERMMQSATYGAQLFESAMVQHETAPSDTTRSPKRKEPEEVAEPSDGAAAAPPKRQVNNSNLATCSNFIYSAVRRPRTCPYRRANHAVAVMLRQRLNGGEGHLVIYFIALSFPKIP